MPLMPVETARARILKNVKPVSPQTITLDEGAGRVLAASVKARRAQPPFDASAMDGYAAIASDLRVTPVSLKVIGASVAGKRYRGRVRSGETVRIFTGAPLPKGADTVVVQENTATQSRPYVSVLQPSAAGQNIRKAGLDFQRGEVLIPAGSVLNARDMGLAASANTAYFKARRRPVVAILATGDELVAPGSAPNADQIISSNSAGLMAMVRRFGGEPVDLGIIPDRMKAIERAIARARKADILLTTGGASVGEHDYVQAALKNVGVRIAFWKIAMRPGKPFMYGRWKGRHVLGMPGNPVSALVCARLFLKPLLDRMLGLEAVDELVSAKLGAAMKANDLRQDYVRAAVDLAPDGSRTVTPFARQDSSMQRIFRQSQALIVRLPHAPAAETGELVQILLLDF